MRVHTCPSRYRTRAARAVSRTMTTRKLLESGNYGYSGGGGGGDGGSNPPVGGYGAKPQDGVGGYGTDGNGDTGGIWEDDDGTDGQTVGGPHL